MPTTPDLDAVFHALGDPTRRTILSLLTDGERSTGVIAQKFPLSRPAISKHLAVLHEAGLVERRQAGRNQLYSIQPEPLAEARDWIERYQEFWRLGLARLKKHVEEAR